MKSKINIFHIFILSILILLIDRQFLRLFEMEYSIKQLHQRIDEIDMIKMQLQQRDAYLLGQIRMVKQQLSLTPFLQIFKTTQSPEFVDDATIGSNPQEGQFNAGAETGFRVGLAQPGTENRVLLKFNEIQPWRLKIGKIAAATIYFNVNETVRCHYSDELIIEVFALLNEWKEGAQKRWQATLGEVTWDERAFRIDQWGAPGAGLPGVDYGPTVLATSGAGLSVTSDGWVALGFNAAGLEKLRAWLNGEEPYHGFLLKAKMESGHLTLTEFFSSEHSQLYYRPYLEIEYFEAIPGTKEN